MTEIVMPRLSDSMEEGTIIRWLKEAGAQVARGEELVEIETDKATMTYEADAGGVLEIVAPGGRHAADRRADRSHRDIALERAGGARSARRMQSPSRTLLPRRRRRTRRPPPLPPPTSPPTSAPSRACRRSSRRTLRHRVPHADGDAGRLRASPVARRIARERGVDLGGTDGHRPGRADREGRRRGGRERCRPGGQGAAAVRRGGARRRSLQQRPRRPRLRAPASPGPPRAR